MHGFRSVDELFALAADSKFLVPAGHSGIRSHGAVDVRGWRGGVAIAIFQGMTSGDSFNVRLRSGETDSQAAHANVVTTIVDFDTYGANRLEAIAFDARDVQSFVSLRIQQLAGGAPATAGLILTLEPIERIIRPAYLQEHAAKTPSLDPLA